ncbi:hypothetical protein CMUST_11535 [Corynebacterium mustelae]|uniref:Lipid/polyisoprenoid-binding YceI-like domain-containing protein n=1 Tax=Corynebacterium mustelae TaxID=571915 RepID=A0A0G3H491_9CORY|nr:YceI family protein [Corynebacterium mustelae]AKK06618.1 hypothetical protein CMUST_11535 [Corynebacterium mustelae]
MKKGLIAAAVLAAVAIAGVIFGTKYYASKYDNSNVAAPSVTTEAKPADSADLTGTWTVGDGSFAGYRVGKVLNGENLVVVGRTENVTGDASLNDGTLLAASIEVDLASVTSGEDARDKAFRDEILKVNDNPTATFVVTEPVKVSSGSGPVEVTGDLTLNGQTKPVTATLEIAKNDSVLEVAGTVPMTWSDFGIVAPDLGFAVVDKTGDLEFQLNLTQ